MQCMLFDAHTHILVEPADSGASSLPKLTAKSYMPRKTAPPIAIADVLGIHPANRAEIPSLRKMEASRGPKDSTEGDG